MGGGEGHTAHRQTRIQDMETRAVPKPIPIIPPPLNLASLQGDIQNPDPLFSSTSSGRLQRGASVKIVALCQNGVRGRHGL